MGRFFQCCTGPLVVPPLMSYLNLPSHHNLRTFLPEISGSTEERVTVVFKLSFKYFKASDRWQLSPVTVLSACTPRWHKMVASYPLCVKISRIRQSGSSAVRCLTWTSIPAHLPGRTREQVEKTTALSGGSPVSCAGAQEPFGGLAGDLTVMGEDSQEAVRVDSRRLAAVTS